MKAHNIWRYSDIVQTWRWLRLVTPISDSPLALVGLIHPKGQFDRHLQVRSSKIRLMPFLFEVHKKLTHRKPRAQPALIIVGVVPEDLGDHCHFELFLWLHGSNLAVTGRAPSNLGSQKMEFRPHLNLNFIIFKTVWKKLPQHCYNTCGPKTWWACCQNPRSSVKTFGPSGADLRVSHHSLNWTSHDNGKLPNVEKPKINIIPKIIINSWYHAVSTIPKW